MDTRYKNKKRARKGLKPLTPLYTDEDVMNTLKLIREYDYHEEFQPTSNINAKYNDAGHIMGSGFLSLNITENNIT